MTATKTLTVPPTQQTIPGSGNAKRLWKAGAVAGLTAAVATVGVAALAQAVDVSLEVGGKSIPLLGFAQMTLVATIIGTIFAVVVSHRARQPRRTFVVTTIALTVLTIVPDVVADAHTATKSVLALSHVVAAAIVIPALAWRLSD